MRKGIYAGLVALSFGVAAAEEPACPPACPPACQPVPMCPCPCDKPTVWVSGDYLLWWIKRAPVPVPLATTGPFNPDTFRDGIDPAPAALGSPGTVVLFGGQGVNFNAFSGGRLAFGVAPGQDGTVGMEAGGFVLERRAETFSVASGSDGRPFLGVPFLGANDGREHVAATAFAPNSTGTFPGLSGRITIANTSRLWGLESNVAPLVFSTGPVRVVGLAGLRYLDLYEALELTEVIEPTPGTKRAAFNGGSVRPDQTVQIANRFDTRNHFWGGQVGARWEYASEWATVALTTKLALGWSHQRVGIDGSSTLFTPGAAAQTVPGGLLALPSNIGVHHRDAFAVVPEVGLNVAIPLSSWARAVVGYSFLYVSDVARPGEQIDRVVDTRVIPTSQFFTPGVTSPRPAPVTSGTDFWAHGLNFGMELRF